MRELKILFENNGKWVRQKLEKEPDYFKERAGGQEARFLWVGCSDSRVPANEIVGLEAGEIFVHRNVANLFPHTDFNCLSVLEFGIDLLKIKHIIVCGHYGCGGVKAAMENHHLGLVDNWLRIIRDVYANNKEELEKISDLKARYDRLVELNVAQQVLNICHTTIVQSAWERGHPLHIHGWVYDMESGHLKDLNCCVSSQSQLQEIYHVKTK